MVYPNLYDVYLAALKIEEEELRDSKLFVKNRPELEKFMGIIHPLLKRCFGTYLFKTRVSIDPENGKTDLVIEIEQSYRGDELREREEAFFASLPADDYIHHALEECNFKFI